MIHSWWVRKMRRGAKSPVGYHSARPVSSKPRLEALEGRLLLATDTWSGAGLNNFWSNGANWGGTAPSAGDTLIFPTGAARTANMNDLTPGITFASVTFSGSPYNITGNPFTVSGGITGSNSTGTNFLNVDVTLSGPQTFSVVNTGSGLNFAQLLHLGGNTLTVTGLGSMTMANVIDGTGSIISSAGRLTFSANNTYSGHTTVNGGALLINGSQPNSLITVSGGTLGGAGTVGAVTVTGGTIAPGSPGTAVLKVNGNVSLDATSSVNVGLNGTLAGQGYDQLSATGTINLGGSTLNASLSFPSAVGNTYTIVHSGGGLSGTTFQGLADHASFTFSGKRFSIHYTANDVVLTQIPADTTTAIVTSVNTAVFGQAINFTATVSPIAPNTGTPTGTVSFTVDGGAPSTATLTNGKATLSTLSLSVGNHTIAATYNGDVNFNPNGPVTLPQIVSKANSAIKLTASPNPSGLGNNVTFTATVSAVSPGIGTPTGTLTFAIDGTPQAPLNLVGAQAMFSTSILTAGNHTITATYSGDGNFNTSVSSALTQTVRAIASSVTVVASPNPSVFGQPVTLTAMVTPAAGQTGGTPTGTVEFDNLNVNLGSATLQGGVASLTVTSLSHGTFDIVARYKGDSVFAPAASNTLIQTVSPAPTTTALMASIASILQGTKVTFSVQVTASGQGAGAVTGNVVFMNGTTTIGQANIFNSTATFTTSSFLFGKNSITAVYSGLSNFAGSTSAPVVIEVGTPDQRFIAQMYVDLLNRPVDASGFTTWMLQISQGHTHAQIVQAIVGSQEYRTDVIESYYHLYLHRDADGGGLAFFLNRMAVGDTQEQVAAAIVGSSEYFSTRGHGTNDGFLDAFYQDTLGRAVDANGRSFFDSQFAAGLTTAQAAAQIFGSGEYRQDLIQGYYGHFLHRQPDPVGMSIFLNALASGARDEDLVTAIVGSAEYTSLA
jgi:autotransporter-associated beta strand protein